MFSRRAIVLPEAACIFYGRDNAGQSSSPAVSGNFWTVPDGSNFMAACSGDHSCFNDLIVHHCYLAGSTAGITDGQEHAGSLTRAMLAPVRDDSILIDRVSCWMNPANECPPTIRETTCK